MLSHPSTNLSKKSLCVVCGDIARGVNYGALSCPACRAFFRRHGFRPVDIRSCPSNGQCELYIHNQQRRACASCRLAKCLAVGMNVDYFRKIIQEAKKCRPLEKVAQHQSQKFVSQFPTLDLLTHNRSSLTSTHWTLLSNVVHAYDNFSSIPATCCTIKQLSKFPTSQLSDLPIMMKINEYALSSLISFVRCIPDFQILTTNEQRSLLERNIEGISGINFIFVTRDSDCMDSSAFLTNIASIYGSEVIPRMKYLQAQLDSDSTLIKLILVIIAFSSNCSALIVPENMHNDTLLLGTFRLFGSQNVYVELLWKYMVYRYGYHGTVIRFAYLIKEILYLLDHITKYCTKNGTQPIRVDNFFDEKKGSLINSPNKHIPVWGNT